MAMINPNMRRNGGMPLEPDDPRHGTSNGYTSYGCRCDPCREARSRAKKDYPSRRIHKLAARHAAQWMKAHCPREWSALVDAEWEKAGLERPPAWRQTLAPNHPDHGAMAGYHAGCRCVSCKVASKQHNAERRAAKKVKVPRVLVSELMKNPDDPNHGTKLGYSRGCRCAPCTNGNREYQQQLVARRNPLTW